MRVRTVGLKGVMGERPGEDRGRLIPAQANERKNGREKLSYAAYDASKAIRKIGTRGEIGGWSDPAQIRVV